MWDAVLSNIKVAAESEYNKRAKHFNPLKIRQHVQIQDHITKKWLRSKLIIGVGKSRDYHVKLPSGGVYWRNRHFFALSPPKVEIPKRK